MSGFALGFIVVCLIVYLLHAAAAIMIPFVIAVFVWYLINAIARGLGRIKSLPRFLCFLLAIFLLAGGLWFIYKLIIANAAEVVRAAPVYQKKFANFLPSLLEAIPQAYRPNPGDLAGYLNVGGFITMLVKTFTGVAGKTLVVLFYTGFLLYEQRFFGRKLQEMTQSAAAEARVHKTLRNIDVNIQRYIWVMTAVSAMTGISTWLLLSFFNVDFAAFWGAMAFVLNFIPYLGSMAAIVLPAIIALAQLNDPASIAAVVAGLGLIQIFWGSIVTPRAMGDTLNLSPIFIIFSLAGWGMIWGVPGMFLAVPILAMIAITLAQFPRTRPIAVLFSKSGVIEPEGREKK